jgi:cell division protein FtsB
LIAGVTVNQRSLIVMLYSVLFLGLGGGALALLRDAVGEYNQLKLAESTSQRRLADAQTRLAEQEKILVRLRADPVFVEKVIRQRLGYAKPGEFVFRFEN